MYYKDIGWSEFELCSPETYITPVREEFASNEIYYKHLSAHNQRVIKGQLGDFELWKNNLYIVQVYRKDMVLCHSILNVGTEDNPYEDWPEMIHLSIKRIDREPIMDWRHLQRIKNEILGEDYEAVQLFPKTERLVDTSNQYHLWAIADPKMVWPFGYMDREVIGTMEAEQEGAKQRKLV
mgnify:CR=1 FL=1|tara:strand:- start:258 stop:797 length:540 start_codon:yes stop_codon:yes gene_type:complete